MYFEIIRKFFDKLKFDKIKNFSIIQKLIEYKYKNLFKRYL